MPVVITAANQQLTTRLVYSASQRVTTTSQAFQNTQRTVPCKQPRNEVNSNRVMTAQNRIGRWQQWRQQQLSPPLRQVATDENDISNRHPQKKLLWQTNEYFKTYNNQFQYNTDLYTTRRWESTNRLPTTQTYTDGVYRNLWLVPGI